MRAHRNTRAHRQMDRGTNMEASPRCGSGLKCRLEAPPLLHPLAPEDPSPPHQPGPPSRTLAKRAKGGGGRGKERAGREGVLLEGRVLQLQWGMGVGTLQTPVVPRPTSGGSQKHADMAAICPYKTFKTVHRVLQGPPPRGRQLYFTLFQVLQTLFSKR